MTKGKRKLQDRLAAAISSDGFRQHLNQTGDQRESYNGKGDKKARRAGTLGNRKAPKKKSTATKRDDIKENAGTTSSTSSKTEARKREWEQGSFKQNFSDSTRTSTLETDKPVPVNMVKEACASCDLFR